MKNPLKEKALRRKAEKILSKKPKRLQKTSSVDTEKLIHELEVHQVELEMQNQELRKAQEQIEESRSRYMDLYDFAPVGYFTVDRKGIIVEANLTGASLLGVKRGRLLKAPFTRFLTLEDRDRFRECQRKVFRVPGRQSAELRLERKAGAPLWVGLEGAALEGPDGNLAGVRLALIDITERKKAEKEILKLNAELEARVEERTAQLEGANKALKDEIAERKRAEEEISRSEREFRGIFELSSVGMAQRDPSTGVIIRVNEKLCEMTGYSAKELLNQKDIMLTHPDDRKRDQEVQKPVFKGESDTWVIEKRYVRKNGEVIWVQVNGRMVRDSSGRPFRTIAIIQDVTERKRTEEVLVEAKERASWLARFPAENPNPVMRVGAEGKVLYCNPAAKKLPGWSCRAGQILPVPLLRLFGEAMVSGVETQKEFELGGKLFSVWAVPMIKEGYANLYGRDVTERRLAEEERERARQDLDRAQEVGQIGSWRLDVRRNVLTWSDENYRIFGIPAGAPLTYETFLKIVHPDDRQYVDAKWQAALRGEPYEVEHRILVGQRVKWVREKAYLEFEDEGELRGGFGITQDITGRKRVEEALFRSEARFRLLSETAERLLKSDNPQGIVNELCRRVMSHLDCQAFFNFLVVEGTGRLHLNACAGIPEEEARKIEWLDYGVAVCGCAARDGVPIITADIFNVPDPRTELVKSYGIRAYACHPLKIGERLIGTLSFGTKTRVSFSDEDLALMRTVTDQVAIAMERVRLLEDLRRSRDELEIRVRERTEELRRSQQRLQQLASQLLLAQENERRRVAVELHDGLMSELAATKYLLEGRIQFLENGKTINAGDLRRVADILGGTMKEARRLMNNLHPSMLDELGLIATIGWLGLEYQNSYPHISVQKEMTVSEEEIAEGVKVVIYRVLQEALHNFARHGKGDRVEISLSKADGILTLVIRDNGQGFDVGAVKMGFGLESMRERVEISGGEFQIESAIGQGTALRATWASLQSSSAAFARREPTR